MRSAYSATLSALLVATGFLACSNSTSTVSDSQAGGKPSTNTNSAGRAGASKVASGGNGAVATATGGTTITTSSAPLQIAGSAGTPANVGSGGASTGGIAAVAGSPSDGGATNGGCTKDSDCPAIPTRPDGCSVPSCVSGTCSYLTVDADGDGVRTKRCQSLDPNVGVNVGRDCDDADPLVSPLGWDGPATDALPTGCGDGLDNDCSGTIDDGVTEKNATCTCAPGETTPCSQTASGLAITFPALDSTGKPIGICKLGSKTCQPNGTWAECVGALPPVTETCDGSDNDCDGIASKIDSDTPKPNWLCDADSDGHLAKSATAQKACDAPKTGCAGNWLLENSAPMDDCSDSDSSMYPGSTELCDGKDNNCNQAIDDAAVDMKTWSYDADGDLYRRTEFATVASCTAPTAAPTNCAGLQTSCPATAWHGGATALPTGDCNDNAANRSPSALKDLCDGTDYNCDGSNLSGCACQAGQTQSCGEHAGYDGKGTCKAGSQTCIGGAWGDCTGSIGPVPEKCGTADLDCDGTVGNSDASATDKSDFYCDADSDKFLAPNATKVVSCLTPTSTCAGTWRKNPAPGDFTDCKDTDNAVYPGASERCNLIDDNCDKSTGLSTPAAEPTEDEDGDGYASTTAGCTGGSLPRSDCWDKDARVHPGQTTRYADGYCTSATYAYWCGNPSYRNCTSTSACYTVPSAGIEANYDFNCDAKQEYYGASQIGLSGNYEAQCTQMVPAAADCATKFEPWVKSGTCGHLGLYRACQDDGTGAHTIGTSIVYICKVYDVTNRNVECL